MSAADEIARATALFKDFHNRAPTKDEIVRLSGFVRTPVGLLVGECISVGYRAAGDGKDYYHEFLTVRPRLYVNDTGKQAYLIGGVYRFTSRGFIK